MTDVIFPKYKFVFISQNVFSEIKRQKTDVLTRFCDHDVVIVAIPNTQNISSHTVAAAGVQKLFHSLLELQNEKQFVTPWNNRPADILCHHWRWFLVCNMKINLMCNTTWRAATRPEVWNCGWMLWICTTHSRDCVKWDNNKKTDGL